ncbi:MAG TPA: CPBP family glutamic-type intramembrane protease [Blastocatellia bacterium]|nr:CPBP family glutamic-type intramembrane protease [Blastocatellia bacterium]
MIEPLSHAAACRACGAPFSPSVQTPVRFCPYCGAEQAAPWSQPDAQPYPPPADQYPFQAVTPAPQPLDPDHPRWGIWTGIGTWAFSVAALLVVSVAAVTLVYFFDMRRGIAPAATDRAAVEAWQMTPHVAATLVYSTIAAHLLTILFCWVVVTRLRSQPFFESLGWHWAGRSPLFWLMAALGVFVGIIVANMVFLKILPQKKTPFDDLIQSGVQVRIAIALLASFSAPLVEEIIYRGVLFSGLRKRFSAAATVAFVTLLFVGVHVPQYWGAWASIAGLVLLSLTLTVVRATSKSLLPCIVIHFINNAIVSVLIVLGKGDV